MFANAVFIVHVGMGSDFAEGHFISTFLNCKTFEIPGTIYSNSEKKIRTVFDFYWRFIRSPAYIALEQLQCKLEKIIGMQS